MLYPDCGHVNGFYLGQFLGMLGWRSGQAAHPLTYLDPDSEVGLDTLAALLLPHLDALGEAQEAALARTWAYALNEFDDRDLGWFLLGRLPEPPRHPRAFLAGLALRLFPRGLPDPGPHARRLDRPQDSLFDLVPPPERGPRSAP